MHRLLAAELALLVCLAPAVGFAQELPSTEAPAPPPVPSIAPPAPTPPNAPAGPVQPGYVEPGYSQPGYAQPGYPQPQYGGQKYGYGYGYVPPAGPPPPPPLPPPACCRWSLRIDPLDLVFNQLTFQTEVAVAGPFALEIDPSWIFNTPTQNVDAKGLQLTGAAVFYLQGRALRGFFLKALGTYERKDVTVANPSDTTLTATQTLSSAVLGGMFGNAIVFGRDGGFALVGEIGFGVATAKAVTIEPPGDPSRGIRPGGGQEFYTGLDRFRILGNLGIGVTF